MEDVRPPGRDQTALVVLGIASVWGLLPSAAVDIRTLLEEVFDSGHLVSESTFTADRDETAFHLEKVVYDVKSGTFADTTWVQSASKEAGEPARLWRTGRYPDEFESGEIPGSTEIRCLQHPARALRLGFRSGGDERFWDTISLPVDEPPAQAKLEG